MLKRDVLKNPNSCLNKAAPDEPVFVLRAKDPLAAQTVRLWAQMNSHEHEHEKAMMAMKEAEEMEMWRKKNLPQYKEGALVVDDGGGDIPAQLSKQACYGQR